MKLPNILLQDEDQLAERAAESPAAFGELYQRSYDRIYNYVRYRVNDRETAEDLSAQVFEQLLVHIGNYDPDKAPFEAWLFGFARNIVNRHYRAEQRRRWLSLDSIRGLRDKGEDIEKQVIQSETETKLLQALKTLDKRQRDLLGLKFAARLTNRQIAALTGLSESNVGVILFRTIHRLREELSRQGEMVGNNPDEEQTYERA
ncbi:MAG: sigma-70 family RNA polymerase sigma factor [Anaerolineales bacterium]|nr:sigma-70 family RNA polymerase sigma factor [Anaerolineales bacterium]